MIRNVFFYLFVILTVAIGCKSDDSVETTYDLDGNWQIYEAYRNEEITTTLEDGYFLFKDSIMETNILGSPISGAYIMDENAFEHQSSLPVKYFISSYSAQDMQLDTEIRGFKFRFKLNKANDSIPAN